MTDNQTDTEQQTNPNKPSLGQYGSAFQSKVLQALLCDRVWAQQVMEVFDPEYFDRKHFVYLADRYFSYWKKYKAFPTFPLLVTIIRDELKTGLDVGLRDQIIGYLQEIKENPDPGDLAYVKERSLDFCRRQALKGALEEAVDMIQRDQYESIVDVVKRAVTVGNGSVPAYDFFEDREARFHEQSRRVIPTGVPEVDKALNGGLGAGELGCMIGATGSGKCSFPTTRIRIKHAGIRINGKVYRLWDRVPTKRGTVYARDVVPTDELT